ncbi:hypothetical protein [Kitasatospora sp. CMC57]
MPSQDNALRAEAAQAEAGIRTQIATRSTEQLCYDFAATEGLSVADPAVPMVRGWLMDELEQRDVDALDAWLESGEDLPHRFFGVAPEQFV